MRQLGHRLLSGVDQIGVDIAFGREGANAKHPVFGLQRDGHPFGNVVGDKGRDADAKIDIHSILELLRSACRQLITVPCHGLTS